MKEIKILKDVKASPESGKICEYNAEEILSSKDPRFSNHIRSWLLRNNLAVEVEKLEISKEEKSFKKAPEDKSFKKVISNKAVKTKIKK